MATAARLPLLTAAVLALPPLLAPQDPEPKPRGLLESLFGADGYRATPLPSGADTLTQRSYLEQKSKWLESGFVTEYRAHGHTDPSWDTAVEDLLRRFARLRIARRYPDDNARNRMLHLSRWILERGCEDPLALLAVGETLWMGGEPEPAMPTIEKSLAGFEQRPYPALYSHFAATRLSYLHHDRGDKDGTARLGREAINHLVRAATDAGFAGARQRFYLDFVNEAFGGEITPAARAFIKQLEQAAPAEFYPLLVLQGRRHVDLAFEARGTRWADEVTEAGWRGFEAAMAKARTFLSRAYELYPEFPDAPSHMITVCTATSDDTPARMWFDRSVAAQFDFVDAYRRMLWALWPRWGGSHREMLAFGRECAQTKRFDTEVPRQLNAAVQSIAEELDDAWRAYYPRSTYEQLLACYEGYTAAADQRSQLDTLRSRQVLIAWLAKRHEAAASIYQELGGGFVESTPEEYGTTREALLADLQPHFKPDVLRAIDDRALFADYASAPYGRADEPNPLPCGADAPTWKQFNARRLEWMQATWVGAYREHGRRNDAWDAGVEEALETYGAFVHLGKSRDAAFCRAYGEKLEALRDLGCDDPLVLYVSGAVAARNGDPKQAHELSVRAEAALQACDYPEVFSFYSARRLAGMLAAGGDAEGAAKMTDEQVRRLARAAADPCFRDGNQRHYLMELLPMNSIGFSFPAFGDTYFRELAETDDVDEWIHHVATGLYRAAQAWGVQTKVWSAEQRKFYFGHVDAAREQLTAAHALHPEFPEAAVGMITVTSMSPGPVPAREWFERAVRAHFDYLPAYRSYTWSLREEWGGSHRAMLRFGVECLDTGRFDTDVPAQLLANVWYIGDDLKDRRLAYASGAVYRQIERFFAGTRAEPSMRGFAHFFGSQRAVIAWMAGRYEQAAALWQEQGANFDESWFAVLEVEKADFERDLRTLAGGDK